MFQDEEINLAKSLETNCSQIYSKMFSLEKELNLLFSTNAVNNNNNINNNNNDNSSNSKNIMQLTATLLDDTDICSRSQMDLIIA